MKAHSAGICLRMPARNLPAVALTPCGPLRIVAQRLPGLVPQAHMDMKRRCRCRWSRRAARSSPFGRSARPWRAPSRARMIALSQADSGSLGREGHLELVEGELGQIAVGLDATLLERREKDLAEAAMAADGIERIHVADAAIAAGIDELMLIGDAAE